jgi:hypothetical protein
LAEAAIDSIADASEWHVELDCGDREALERGAASIDEGGGSPRPRPAGNPNDHPRLDNPATRHCPFVEAGVCPSRIATIQL